MGFLGLVDAASGVVSSVLNARQNKLNRQFSHNEAELAYQRQVEQWNRQNAYDSPASQMLRYEQAGLNPNLMYGQMSPGSSMVSAPQASMPSTHAMDVRTDFVGARLAEAQIRDLENQSINRTNLTNAQVADILGDTPWKQADIGRINAVTQSLVQQYYINKPTEIEQQLIAQYMIDETPRLGTIYSDGTLSPLTSYAEEFRDYVREVKFLGDMNFNAKQYDMFMRYFLYQCGLYGETLPEKDRLEIESMVFDNDDMKEFLDHCAAYYKGLADEQSAIGSMAQGDLNFVSKFGGREAFHAITGITSSTIDLVSKIVTKGAKRSPRKTVRGKK